MLIFNKLQQLLENMMLLPDRFSASNPALSLKAPPEKLTVIYHLQDYKEGLAYRVIVNRFLGCKSCLAMRELQRMAENQKALYNNLLHLKQFDHTGIDMLVDITH